MMSVIDFPYGKETISYDFKNEELRGVLTSQIHEYVSPFSGAELVKRAMETPIGSPGLSELARNKKRVVIIASDHTRPVPSRIIIPPMLAEIRKGSPDAEITILIATGCHRETTRAELIDKFGEEIVDNERIEIHRATDTESMVYVGTLPSGGELRINKTAYEAELLLAEGFIEPHFFAGFSGGRKSVLPGVAARETVLANHCSEFIASSKARTGVIDGNPIHEDMLWAAKKVGLRYIVNVVINEKKEAVYAVAGDVEAAHRAGCDFLSKGCRVSPVPADIVVCTNGGYPLDQNIYQSVKGMTAAEATVNDGGVIVMLSRSNDGHGGEGFYRAIADEPDIDSAMKKILARGRNETVPDQWEAQILLRVLKKARVVYVSDADENVVRSMKMYPAKSLEQGIALAKRLVGREKPSFTAIPDGVAVMVTNA